MFFFCNNVSLLSLKSFNCCVFFWPMVSLSSLPSYDVCVCAFFILDRRSFELAFPFNQFSLPFLHYFVRNSFHTEGKPVEIIGTTNLLNISILILFKCWYKKDVIRRKEIFLRNHIDWDIEGKLLVPKVSTVFPSVPCKWEDESKSFTQIVCTSFIFISFLWSNRWQ